MVPKIWCVEKCKTFLSHPVHDVSQCHHRRIEQNAHNDAKTMYAQSGSKGVSTDFIPRHILKLTRKRSLISTTHTHTHTHAHTHTHPFNGPLSGTTQVSRYQKGKTNLDFTEVRNSEWQWHQLGHMRICTSLQTNNHASTPPLSFYRPDAVPAAQSTEGMSTEGRLISTTSEFNLLNV